ncbi:universal stress protein [Streptomyces sp. NPDC020817]|uniref:universal stress protein n=1 Tax=Streptomyces sp. NPDC020817 TaxID=3365095 RepID=UPI0037A35753
MHAWLWQPLAHPYAPDWRTEADRAEKVLSSAETAVTGQCPDLPVSASVVSDGAVPALLRLVEEAGILVIGTRGHGALLGFLLGSYGQQVIAAAPCPVVSVRHAAPDASAPRTGEIVVGQGGVDESGAVLGFAFEAAAARGASVRVVRAWSLPPVYAYSPGSM